MLQCGDRDHCERAAQLGERNDNFERHRFVRCVCGLRNAIYQRVYMLTERVVRIPFPGLHADNPATVNTAILMAVLINRHDLVMRLIHEHGANANASDSTGRTALHLACLTGNQSIGQLLIVNGADVNRWDQRRSVTPLHLAARAKSVECIQLLLRRGASVNAGLEKRSALHEAVEKRALKCVEALLRNGANPNTPQVCGISTLTERF